MSTAVGGSKVRRFGLAGHPVAHSVSPAMMRAAFDQLALECTYDAVDVVEAGLAGLAAELRDGERAGLNVTVPHKVAALALADEVGESAARVGAANVWVCHGRGQIRAENTDAAAIVRVLAPLLTQTRVALVLGSGGAARAALVACEALGFREVAITSRSWATMEQAQRATLPAIEGKVRRQPWVVPGTAATLAGDEVDLVVQATSAGMHGADPGNAVLAPVPWLALGAGAIAFDVVYRPRETPFLASARRHGLVAVDGLGMLVEQAALALKMWLGVEAPRDGMRLAAERALAG